MEYNERFFKERANKIVKNIWLTFNILLTASYASDVQSGIIASQCLPIFMLLCWVPFIIGVLCLKIKGKDTPSFRYSLAIGYISFYTFVICTSPSPIAFLYILPLASIMVLYKSKNFMIGCGIASSVSVLINWIYKASLGMNSDADVKIYSLQLSCVILCYLCYVISINHLNLSDGALTDSIKDNLKQVITTVEQVKGASNAIMNGITVVRELSDENRQGAHVVVDNMLDLSSNNEILHDRTMSSVDMTTDISTQMQNVTQLIGQMVDLTNKSIHHATSSSAELNDVVETTNAMASLSNEVEAVLQEFKKEFAMVKAETGTIEGITFQTNMLALNASIEAARAGEAGKGFAVVADQIRNLSTETQNSSGQIMTALQNLESTSDKMAESIIKTLELIQITLQKINHVNTSVNGITTDSNQLGSNIRIIDTAVKDVESSNQQLVSNMQQICDAMQVMTECIERSDETTKTMLSKYEETATNVNNIESIVNKLMVELGTGGFMGIQDIQCGMKITLCTADKTTTKSVEYKGMVLNRQENQLTVQLYEEEADLPNLKNSSASCKLRIVVENVLYNWDNITFAAAKGYGADCFRLTVNTNPTIINRRKYPRMPISYSCEITMTDTGEKYPGKTINLSANGFAFSSTAPIFADAKNRNITVSVPGFALINDRALDGCIIRSTRNGDEYIVGCRMPEDDRRIRDYIKENYAE